MVYPTQTFKTLCNRFQLVSSSPVPLTKCQSRSFYGAARTDDCQECPSPLAEFNPFFSRQSNLPSVKPSVAFTTIVLLATHKPPPAPPATYSKNPLLWTHQWKAALMWLPVSSLAAETKVTSEIRFKYSIFAERWICLSLRLTCHIKSWRRSVPPAHHTGPFWQQAETGSCLLPTRTVGYSLRPLSPCTGKEKHKRKIRLYTDFSYYLSSISKPQLLKYRT